MLIVALISSVIEADSITKAVLYNFAGPDGENPYLPARLIQAGDGSFYGTTFAGGTAYGGPNEEGSGTVFHLTAAGALTTLHSFSALDSSHHNSDGAWPQSGVTLGQDGNLYGVTAYGGTAGDGTVYKLTPDGSFTLLHTFTGADGANPASDLVQGSDGAFYGTTRIGGPSNDGTVFKIDSGGSLITLHSFDGTNGGYPAGGLVLGPDGSFYGTTAGDSYMIAASIFKITSTGTFSVLYAIPDPADDCDLRFPCEFVTPLTLGLDGNFYGIVTGAPGVGDAIYSISAAGTYTTVKVIDAGNDFSALTQSPDGSFYWSISYSSGPARSVLYRLDLPSATITQIQTFQGAANATGAESSALLAANDGQFYGMTANDGSSGDGTAYRISVQRAAPSAPGNLTAAPGNQTVKLSWTASLSDTSTTYNIYEGTSPGGESSTPLQTGLTSSSATITGLSNGTTYYFKVAGVNSTGASAYSNEAGATPVAPPGQVAGLSAQPGNSQVNLAWSAVPGASGYTIYQGTASNHETVVATGIAGTSYVATGLGNGTKYYFEVSASNAGGTGPVSGEASATPQPSPPAAPTGLSATAGNNSVVLNWNASSGASGYDVYEGTAVGSEGSSPIQTGITGTTAIISGLTNGTTYFFTVAALNAGGTSGRSNEASAKPAAPATGSSGSSDQGGGSGGGGAISPLLLVGLLILLTARKLHGVLPFAATLGRAPRLG